MAGKKESDIFYITHSGELLFWLVVILIVVAISTFLYFKKEKTNNDYTLFMPDVDGLIVGSSVRMMGIPVGYVTKIKPANEEVFVKFIITDDSIKIPRGTIATVEFSGMAGSKSLELYLPDKNTYIDNSTPVLSITPPKRLHDALGLLNDMFDKLGAIIYTSSSFGEKVKNIELPETKEGDFNSFIKYSNTILDESNAKASEFQEKFGKKK